MEPSPVPISLTQSIVALLVGLALLWYGVKHGK